MIRTKTIYLALLAVLLSPMVANADLIQQATVNTNEDGIPDTSFGTLIFPNEFQNPFVPEPACELEDNSGLPLCETGEFLPDKVNFDGFNNLGDFGVEIADSLPLFGAWSIGNDWVVDFIFAWTFFDLGGDYGVLTLVFGLNGNICGTIQESGAVLLCFEQANPELENPNLPGAELLAYRLDPAHSVPEPGTLALLGLGLVGMAARRRKTV